MKWFKHLTNCDRSEGLSELIETFGFAGYGRWFRLLEIVGSRIDGSEKCSCEYSEKKWCEMLGLRKHKLHEFLRFTEQELNTRVTSNGNKVNIEVPNLLKIRDNHTKNLQVTDKKVSLDKEKEEEQEKEEEEETPAPDFLEQLKQDPKYKGLDILKVMDKLVVWCKARDITPTEKKLREWLDSEYKPLTSSIKKDPNKKVSINCPRHSEQFVKQKVINGQTTNDKCPECVKEVV